MTENRWALVDVETSGLSPKRDRVLSVAVLSMDGDRVVDEFASLVNPGCDPGPVHIHGLTPRRLQNAPPFELIAPEVINRLGERTLVAHNATFDHGFLSSEIRRLGVAMPTTQRLCTVALTRRLQLEVPNAKLSTLTRYWGVDAGRAHDARDDVRALSGVFRHSKALADSLGLPLPIVACGDHTKANPGRAVRSASRSSVKVSYPFPNPGRLNPANGLVQGMRVAITGQLSRPRAELTALLIQAGLDVTGSVSPRTSVLVTNGGIDSAKARAAAAHGVPVIDESTLVRLLATVHPAHSVRRLTPPVVAEPSRPAVVVEPSSLTVTQASRGEMAGRRVLVVGGRHLAATIMRSRLVQLGARPAVNLTAGVTDVLVLDGGEGDPRMPRIRERSLRLLTEDQVDTLINAAPDGESTTSGESALAPMGPVVLRAGAVTDLHHDVDLIEVNVSWSAIADVDVDVVAFELDASGHVLSDDNFVFYNQPTGPGDNVQLSIDGDSEQAISLRLTDVSEAVDRIVVAAAIEGDRTFGDLGPIGVTAEDGERAYATAVLDAATTERSMILAEIYRRNTRWRLRAVGQGYDDGLGELAIRYGVEVDA